MNPLSALGSLPLSSLQSLPQQLGRSGAIPQAELQKLSALVGPSGPPDLAKFTSSLPGAGPAGVTESLANRGPGASSPLPPTGGPDGFGNLLGQMVNDVSAKGAASSEAVNGLLSGKDVSLHQTMIAVEEASVSFQLMVEVRNKLLESYQELMRMQV